MKKFQSFATYDDFRGTNKSTPRSFLNESETFEEEQDTKRKKVDTKAAMKQARMSYKDDIKNNPDDQVDIAAQENVKFVGKLIRFSPQVTPKNAVSILESYKLSPSDVWYYFVESSNRELHFIKYNERKSTDMKFFVESLINHYLKNGRVSENIKSAKIIGNSNFVIIKEAPPKFYNMIKEDLIKLLSSEDLD